MKPSQNLTLLSNCVQTPSNFNLALNKEPESLKTDVFRAKIIRSPLWLLMISFWTGIWSFPTLQRPREVLKHGLGGFLVEIIFLAIYRKEFNLICIFWKFKFPLFLWHFETQEIDKKHDFRKIHLKVRFFWENTKKGDIVKWPSGTCIWHPRSRCEVVEA